jgi:phosphoribosylamine--glycine ligase
MTRFAFYIFEGSSIAWSRRLFDEGCDVLVYHQLKDSRKVGTGLVPLTESKEEWLAWGEEDPQTIYFFDCSGAGEFAEELMKKGKLVIGSGPFMDKLEKDRNWGEELAEKVGILCPPTKRFTSISAAMNFLESDPDQEHGDGGWAWKSNKFLGSDVTLVSKDTKQIMEHLEHVTERFGDNISCILQEKIKGVAVSTARWFNGKSFVGPYEGTIENKKFMNDGKGPSTGCALNTVWFYTEESKLHEQLHFDKLEVEFRLNNAPPGLYDVNCILNKKGAWFLEWTPRLGIDSELTSQRGITSLCEFLKALVLGQDVNSFFKVDSCYHAVRLSVPPYPNEVKLDKSSALGIRIKGYDGLWEKFFVGVGVSWDEEKDLHVSDPTGFVGVACTESPSITEGFEKIYKFLEKLSVQDLQYRTDAADIIIKDVEAMLKAGYELTPFLRR